MTMANPRTITMDLTEKLKYYKQSGHSEQRSQGNRSDIVKLAEKFKGKHKDGVIKICRYFAYNQFIPENPAGYPETIFLPTLTKKQFSDVFPLDKTVVLDLETTGLAGGTGTYPFLIGFGYPGAEGIELVQYFLPDYGREIGAFLDMKQEQAEKSILISYNGKSFDYPLLRNRLVLNRVENTLASFNHLDLLHLTRRLWRNSLDTFNLQTIEQMIFKFMRFGDIDGMLIPQAYFDFLHSGFEEDIWRIIEHNQQDILTLVRLLFYLNRIEKNKSKGKVTNTELLNFFKLAGDSGDFQESRKLFKEIKERSIKLPEGLIISFSRLLKRHQCWQEALPFWSDLLASGNMILFACEEFAKYYEHNTRDYESAKKFTERALNYFIQLDDIYKPTPIIAEFERRHQRLLSKLNKNS
jgi:uncharacterized protein YprB with RNaseH-like and TPR domain